MAAFEYKFKIPSVHKVSAQVAGEICNTLSNSPGGLTPHRLVEVSRDENAPMHSEFEWDDSIAGEKYREEQAKKVIQHLVIVKTDINTERNLKLVQETKQEIKETLENITYTERVTEIGDEDTENKHADRSFVSTGERTSQYVPLAWALSNEQWKANLLEAAKRDMRAFIAKYHRLEELASIIDDMNDILGA